MLVRAQGPPKRRTLSQIVRYIEVPKVGKIERTHLLQTIIFGVEFSGVRFREISIMHDMYELYQERGFWVYKE